MSSSFVSQVMQPGGGVMLLPFVRVVIGCLMLLTMSAFLAGVARIHMAVLTVLSGGLLASLSFFESEFKKAQRRANSYNKGGVASSSTSSQPAKEGHPVKSD